jgi:ankyrin repeat protein
MADLSIHKAVSDADDATFEVLLDAGADPKAADYAGAQAIHMLFFFPRVRTRTIDALIAHGVDVNARCSKGSTALHWASLAEGDWILDNIRHQVHLTQWITMVTLPSWMPPYGPTPGYCAVSSSFVQVCVNVDTSIA